MSMTIAGVSAAVQEILESVDAPVAFVDIQAAPESSDQHFNGYPSATHFYVNTENNYATVTQNRRVIQYNVYVYMVSNAKTEAQKWASGYAFVDSVIQKFDESIDLNGACDIMRPAPGRMSKESLTNGEGLVAEIILYCEADVTFRTPYN